MSDLAPTITRIDPSDPKYDDLNGQYGWKLGELKRQLGVSTSPIEGGAVFHVPAYYSGNTNLLSSLSQPDNLGRPLPSFATTSSRFRVELTASITPWDRDAADHVSSSEVWHGLLSSGDSPSIDKVGTQGNTSTMNVIVKFLQPSLLYLPDDPTESTNADHQARNEAAGYDHLERLQGSVIPYFFGKHIVSFFKKKEKGNSDLDFKPDSRRLFRLLLRVESWLGLS